MAIHGNKSQAARTRALAEFKTAKLQVLVATDIAARGIDIIELPHVVNYELPNVSEDYVHRIGRTGRAGSNGEASSLVCIDEHKLLHDIERLIKREIPVVQVPGFEPDPRIKAEPILNGQNRGQGGRGQGRGQSAPRSGGGQARTGSGQARTGSGPRTGGGKPAGGASRGAVPAAAQHRSGGRGR
jgi:ATP-dependent RNA helicase RhlE